MITQRYKLYRPFPPAGTDPDDLPDQLYDLEADPGERNDLAAQQPELVADLQARYEAWFDDIDADYERRPELPRIVVGTPAEDPTVLSRHDWRPDRDLSELGELNPGYSRALEAHWDIRVDRPGTFAVTLRFEPGRFGLQQQGHVHVAFDDQLHSMPRIFGCDVYRFAEIALAEGPVQVRAWAGGADSRPLALALPSGDPPPPDQREAAMYVELSRTA